MHRRPVSAAKLLIVAALASVWLCTWWGLRARLTGQFPVKRQPQSRSLQDVMHLFSSSQDEHEVFRLYREQQEFEYKALRMAMQPAYWSEAIAVEFDLRRGRGPRTRAVRRHRLVWDVFGPFYSCPFQQRVGTPPISFDGGKWLCGVKQLLQGPECVVYSFGSDGQVTFEQALIRMTHGACEVHVFDFSLTEHQIARVKAVKGVTFHAYGIGARDELVSQPFFYGKRNVTSYELKSFPTIMAEHGHEWIDVLKLDVEGAEYEVLQAIVKHYHSQGKVVPVTQAQIEYHHSEEQPSRHELLTTLTMFEKSGFRAFHQEYNYHGEAWHFIEYAYLQVNNDGQVVYPIRSSYAPPLLNSS